MVNLVHIAGDIGLIIGRLTGLDLLCQWLPGVLQRQVFFPHVCRHVKTIELLQCRGLQRLLILQQVLFQLRGGAGEIIRQPVALHAQ
ncbi:hypothetical protein D3C80_1062990 [compost metagenome]